LEKGYAIILKRREEVSARCKKKVILKKNTATLGRRNYEAKQDKHSKTTDFTIALPQKTITRY
jgi:hypothetical protein